MNKTDIVIDVRNVSKRYEIYNSPRDRLKQLILPNLHQKINRTGAALKITSRRESPRYFREFWALNDISFQVRKGEMVGIIGRNGSGKSTLLQILVGTLYQTMGQVSVNGRVAALLELGSGFNPHFSGRDNILLNGQILGLTKKEVEARYDQIVEFADIGEFIDQPVKTYSSGMYMRLAFAVQAHIDASIVVIDEALAVGDVFFRQKCYTRLEQIRNSGAAILLVSHSMPDIEQYCERAILLDHGVQKFIGPASEAAKHYYLLHQTQAQTPIVEKQSTETAPRPLPDPNSPIIDRAPPEAFIDLSNKSQISNGQARCIGVALCNEVGQPCNSFRQGDVAVFYTEYELAEAIGVPICGIVISNERGVIVHGKNSWQFENAVPETFGAGSKVLCRQEVKLDLGPGEYLFEIGLASVSNNVWMHRERISHEEMSVRHSRNCHIADVGSFSVGPSLKNGIPILTHHGIANLPGNMHITVETNQANDKYAAEVQSKQVTQSGEGQATIFHITHWKAGSQWIYKILKEIAPERIVAPKIHEKQFLDSPLVKEAIYPTLYLTNEQFHSVQLPDNYRKLIIIRDLRDTLVSGYFSMRYSHALLDSYHVDLRQRLNSMTIEEGLLMLMDEFLPSSARIQQSWVEAGEAFIRYEDLLEKDSVILEELLIGTCEIKITPERLREIIVANRFENLTGGRKPGEESHIAHERKGISGDWKNYFTPFVAEKFILQYGKIHLDAGYSF